MIGMSSFEEEAFIQAYIEEYMKSYNQQIQIDGPVEDIQGVEILQFADILMMDL